MIKKIFVLIYLLSVFGQFFGLKDDPTQKNDVTTPEYDNMIHLVGGKYPNEGNVYVMNSEGYYGPLCDDFWRIEDANVVCRQLGYDGAIEAIQASHFGIVPLHHSMDDIGCLGSESTIQECTYVMGGWNYGGCSYGEGAGVICHKFPPSSCPLGWLDASYYNSALSMCYLFAHGQGFNNFLEAETFCEDQEGYLAEPISEEQYNLLASLVRSEEFRGKANWWIGLNDVGHEGDWMWQHREVLSDFFMWGSGQPSSEPNNHEDCVIMDMGMDFLWADVDCFSSQANNVEIAPICQLPLQLP